MTSIASWINNAKRIAVDLENSERKTFSYLKDDEFQREWNELFRSRQDSKASIARRVDGLKSLYLDIRDKVRDNGQAKSNSLNIQNALEAFELKLTSFKLAMRSEFDMLEQQEKSLEDEISRVGETFESWMDEGSAVPESKIDIAQKKKLQERKNLEINRKSTIGALDRKIASIGRTDGWDIRDHESFLRVWNQVINNDEFMSQQQQNINSNGNSSDDKESFVLTQTQQQGILKKAQQSVLGKSVEEMETHIQWYLSYLYLHHKKKLIVAEWKAEAMKSKIKKNEETIIHEVLNETESIDDIDLNENTGLNKKPVNEDTKRLIEEERQAAKQRIAKWKNDRLLMLEKEKMEKEQLKLKESREVEEENRKRQQIIRMQLEKWKKSEQLSNELMKEAETKLLPNPPVDHAAMRQRQARDLERARLKHEKIDTHTQKKTERERKIREANVNTVFEKEIVRDPLRLQSGTKASDASKMTYEDLDALEHRRQHGSAHSAPIAMSGRDLQYSTRGAASWCNRATFN